MKKIFTLILLSMIAFNTIHADIKWALTNDSTLTISGTDMPNYRYNGSAPWYSKIDKIKKVVIANGVRNIGNNAFWGCSNLTSVTIPNSVTSIGESSFSNCKGLASITIPRSVKSIGKHAFANSRGLASIIVEEGNTRYDSRNDCNAIIETESNTLIKGCNNTIIPNSVTSIGESALQYCSALTSITIPESVTNIGPSAFRNCSGLTSITFPEFVTSIGNTAFFGCSGLTSIHIPNSVTKIGTGAFGDCSGLTSIIVKEGNTKYDSRNDCNAIIETESNTLITGCQNTNIPNSVTNIGDSAFYNCLTLTSITIPNSMVGIGKHAFRYCSSLTSITIPNSVTNIGTGAFSACSGLTSIIIEEGNSKYDSRNNCNAIIETKSNTLITGCMNSIIPNSVTSIGVNAFWNCSSLTSIIIPNSVTTIGDDAFGNCVNLSSIICEASTPPICYKFCFDNVNKLIPVYVPLNSNDAYIVANEWKDFTNLQIIVEPVNISFANENEKLIVGNTKTLYAIIKPENAINKTITWTSSNKAVATVSTDGVITAKSKGTTTITAKTYNGKTAKCTITVEQPVTAITLSDETGSLWIGDTKTLTATATPTTANNTSVNWTSSNNNVATVSSEGVITAKAKGTCTIICTAADGYGALATCPITVKQQVISISLNEVSTSLWVGEMKTISATVTPTSANNTDVKWSSSDTKVAIVSSDGTIMAIGKGSCSITCTAADGYGTTCKCEVTVKQPVTAITLNATTTSLWVGDTKTLTATATPTTASNTAVEWSSSDNSVATISADGVIAAKGQGTCTITCTAADGYGTKSICEVTVKQQVNSITLNDATVSLWTGETKTLTANATPTTAGNTAVEWSSSDNSVAIVSAEGVITAKGQGTCTITCTAADGYGTSSTCEVSVKQQVTSIALNETTISLWVGDTKTITATATPTTAYNTTVELYSSDYNVATISAEGVITANGEGTCTIICTAADGYGTTSTCEVTVKQQVTSIALSETTVSLWAGETKTLTATATPTTASNTAVKWSSSDNSVATVSADGVITANDEGTCTITCTAADGYGTTSVCEVTVMQQTTSVEQLRVSDGESPVSYNLNGQRINKANVQKGVYIKNGKKYAK